MIVWLQSDIGSVTKTIQESLQRIFSPDGTINGFETPSMLAAVIFECNCGFYDFAGCDTMSISDLFGLNSPRGTLLGNSFNSSSTYIPATRNYQVIHSCSKCKLGILSRMFLAHATLAILQF